jgi:hypothetical protein
MHSTLLRWTRCLSILLVAALGWLPARAQYCATALGGGACDITQVQIVGTTLNTTAGTCPGFVTNNYSGYPASGSTTASLQRSTTYSLRVTTNSADIISAWADWNQNQTFEPSEWVQVAITSTVGVPATVNLTVPGTALSGLTFMRIRTRTTGNLNGSTDACSNFGSGETRDYPVTVAGAAPANDNCATATTLAVTATCTPSTGTTVNATPSTVGATSCGGSSNGDDVWYRIVVPAGMTQLNVATSAVTGSLLVDTVLELYRGTCGLLTSAGCNDDNGTTNFSTVVAAVTPGETIYARVLPYQANVDGAFQICAFGAIAAGNSTTAAPYCEAPNSVGCGNGTISNVTMVSTTLNNFSTCSTNASGYPYYNYPATGSATTTVVRGGGYTLGVTADAGQSVSLWVDWNQNLVFDASEWTQVTASSLATPSSIVLTVPATATLGATRMRVRTRAAGSSNGSADACSAFGSGETEDYTLTVSVVGNSTSAAPYCEAPNSVGCGNGTITNVTLGATALNNSSTCSNNGSGYPYINYPATGATTATVQAGNSYTLGVTTDGGQIVSVWVDWNQNLVFDASEWTQITTSSTGGVANTITLAVPSTALAGNTRIRIRSRAAGSPNGSADPCSTFGSGETEDYTLTVFAVGNTSNPAPYCAAPSSAGCGTGNITSVVLAGTALSVASGCSLNASGYPYINYPASANTTATVQRGTSYNLSVTSELNNIISVWVDWNQNLVFDASEWTQITTSSTAGVPASISLAVPAGAVLGNTRMRIRTRASGSANASTDACSAFGSGEAEDFTITVISCTASTAPGVTGAGRCGTGTVGLAASGAPAGGSYRWYTVATSGTAIAGATAANYTTPSISVTTPYYVSIVTAAGCESARTTVTATVNTVPVANAGVARSFCSGSSAQLGTAAVAGVTYSWSPATGLSSASAAQPTLTLTNTTGAPIITNYTLTATSTQGCSATSTVDVIVNPAAVANAGVARTFCSGGSAQLGSAAVAGTTYSWSPASGLSNASAAQPTVTLNNTSGGAITTTYTLTATANGCPATSTVTVTVNPAPAAVAGPTRTFCSGQSAQLGAAPVAGLSYSWSPAIGLSSASIAQPTVTLTNTTGSPITANYTLTVTNGSGCTATSSVDVTVNSATSAAFSYPAASYCVNGSATPAPSITGTTGGTFSATPAGLSLTAGNGSVNVGASTPGSYLVTYSVGGACPSSSTVALVINPMPTAAIAASGATSFCQGGSVTLTASGGGTYLWSNGAGSQSITVSAAGNYSVTATSASGCSATSAATTVTVNPTPATPIITRTGTTLTSSSPTGNQWYVNGGIIPGANAASYVMTGPGTYTVVVTGAGCPSSPSAPVIVASNLRPLAGSSLHVYPNPTPDGHLTVELLGYSQAVELTLFNALGQQVLTRSVPASAGGAAPRLELTNLAAGVYVLQAATKGGLDTRRVVVNR